MELRVLWDRLELLDLQELRVFKARQVLQVFPVKLDLQEDLDPLAKQDSQVFSVHLDLKGHKDRLVALDLLGLKVELGLQAQLACRECLVQLGTLDLMELLVILASLDLLDLLVVLVNPVLLVLVVIKDLLVYQEHLGFQALLDNKGLPVHQDPQDQMVNLDH